MIDLNSLDLVMYNNKRISGDRYRERVHPSLKKITVYFTALLVNIRYWKVKRRQESNITYGANDDYIRPENEIYGNEALYTAECKMRVSWRNVELVKAIISRNENRANIWRQQCFGPWLDVKSTQLDGQLIHSILRLQQDLNIEPEYDGIYYSFNNNSQPLRFGPREFCVITGFSFGDNTNKNKGSCAFINRVLSNNIIIPFSVDGLKSFLQENEHNFDDADIVRLSLLLLLYTLFMGVETDKRVEKEHLMLVDDFKAWNEFNWGSYLWAKAAPFTAVLKFCSTVVDKTTVPPPSSVECLMFLLDLSRVSYVPPRPQTSVMFLLDLSRVFHISSSTSKIASKSRSKEKVEVEDDDDNDDDVANDINMSKFETPSSHMLSSCKDKFTSIKGRGRRIKKKSKLLQTPYQGFDSTPRDKEEEFSEQMWFHDIASGQMWPFPAIENVDIFYIPVNVDNQHWCLAAIDFPKWSMTVYDR
ncbi:hypothetical protein E3N88_04129 [Mikania micrantha]|uniref:Ubiquitin-like protease family profile domain-containing protein n=1 Tax=Mikania micrantha TaxID=192012 RepID=A0A5N6PVP0_9ASTR|nr:hypothetical protein E3N88_04129 [Mikania micrantha]